MEISWNVEELQKIIEYYKDEVAVAEVDIEESSYPPNEQSVINKGEAIINLLQELCDKKSYFFRMVKMPHVRRYHNICLAHTGKINEKEFSVNDARMILSKLHGESFDICNISLSFLENEEVDVTFRLVHVNAKTSEDVKFTTWRFTKIK